MPLDETDMYVLFQEYESIFLFEKDTNSELWRISTYGEVTCGLIGLSNEWAIVGGEYIVIWKEPELKELEDNDLKWAFDMRQITAHEVEILTDPWSENSAIWRYNVLNDEKIRIRNFEEYRDKEYTDEVNW